LATTLLFFCLLHSRHSDFLVVVSEIPQAYSLLRAFATTSFTPDIMAFI
jgi:hypothetical protein